MKFLKNLKLVSKLSVGFGAILAILLCTVLFGYFGLARINQNFTYYREISGDDTIAGRVQANLLESRIAFKNFLQTGDRTQQIIFEERFSKMERFINELKNNIDDGDKETKINQIWEYSKEYRERFEKVFILKEKRDEIYNKSLNVKGPELEKNLSLYMNNSYSKKYEMSHYGASNAVRSMLIARLHAARYMESHDAQEKEKTKAALAELDQWLEYSQQASDGAELKQIVNAVVEDKAVYSKSFDEVVSIIEESDEIVRQMDEIGPMISSLSEEIKLAIINEQNVIEPVVKKSNDETVIGMLVLTFFALLFSIFIIVFIVSIVVTPIKTVTNTFREISEGDADLEVRLKANSADEIGEMAQYFNRFMVKLQAIMLHNNNQSWLKAGKAELNEKIRGEQGVDLLAGNIIAYVSKYLNAQIGAIYVRTDDSLFRLLGSYAYNRRKNLSDKVKLGEGLIGQAALEKQSIVVTNVPDDYIKVASGVGESVPKNILVAPCMVNQEVKCIIELGSFTEFSDIQLEFIEQISESIAINIQSAESRIKMRELLDKTLEQSEELQVQQEELRQNNEELEEQAKALKESEAKLQAQQEELRQSNEELSEQTRALRESQAQLQSQQEELRVTNEELEERTKSLELQRNDVTAKNKALENAQKEIEVKAKDLEITSRYKSEFLANMSHELRTPLNSILVLSQMLSDKKVNSPVTAKQLEYARTINSSGRDLLKLINDILDLSKVEAGKMDISPEPIELKEFAKYVESSFAPIAEQKKLDFVVDINKDVPDVIVSDNLRLQQIVSNLLSNAFKFTEKGQVSMSISSPDKGINGLENAVEPAGSISIAVKDTGIGIPAEKQEVIFEAFKQSDGTTSRKYGGTGLGLSISRELAKLLGGRIHLDSEEGKGSTFTLILPENIETSAAIVQAASVSDEENLQKPNSAKDSVSVNEEAGKATNDKDSKKTTHKTLLVIEDDASFSNILRDLSYEKGFECIIAATGDEGFELAAKIKPDAIILDIGLPDISGWKVVEKLKEDAATRNTPIHVISGREADGTTEAMNNIIGYVNKPVTLESLDEVFGKLKSRMAKPLKKLLILDESTEQVDTISKALEKKDIQIRALHRGKEALELLKHEAFDCVILDLKLKDMSGLELLSQLRGSSSEDLPVIIHTERKLTMDDEAQIQRYADSIIIKGSRSIDRLAAEASLFLHEIDSKTGDKNLKAIKSSQEKEASLENKKILIVDDDMRNVFALSSILEEKGMKIIIGRNGNEGLEKLEHNPDTNLVLMDVMMPEMDGYEAMQRIRSNDKHRRLPIIALTAKAMKDDRQKCIEAGADEYLTKPIDIDKLISLLRVWLY